MTESITHDFEQPAAVTDGVAAEADTGSWLSRRGALLAFAVTVVLLVITVIVCLVIWYSPATEPLQLPLVPRA